MAVPGQRGADICIQAQAVERAILRAGGRLKILGRALADEVDDGRGIARRRQQTGRAAHDLDMIVDGGVDRPGLDSKAKGMPMPSIWKVWMSKPRAE
jgi:hypothetical protein